MSDKYYTQGEEWANSLTHALGIVWGITGGVVLLRLASVNNEPIAVACVVIYLLGMLSSYVSSTWYHAERNEKRKKRLRKFDHAAIYLHIAGTYTPFTLLTLRDAGAWGYSIFAFVWLAAAAGVSLSLQRLKKHSHLETACYVAMGCIILVAIHPLWQCMSDQGRLMSFYLLIAGGVSYILGAICYSMYKRKYMHSVFHLFCLGGSVCHLIAIAGLLS